MGNPCTTRIALCMARRTCIDGKHKTKSLSAFLVSGPEPVPAALHPHFLHLRPGRISFQQPTYPSLLPRFVVGPIQRSGGCRSVSGCRRKRPKKDLNYFRSAVLIIQLHYITLQTCAHEAVRFLTKCSIRKQSLHQ
jgi:hypothetical protein